MIMHLAQVSGKIVGWPLHRRNRTTRLACLIFSIASRMKRPVGSIWFLPDGRKESPALVVRVKSLILSERGKYLNVRGATSTCLSLPEQSLIKQGFLCANGSGRSFWCPHPRKGSPCSIFKNSSKSNPTGQHGLWDKRSGKPWSKGRHFIP